MNTYIFKCQEITITISATDLDNAYCLLSNKIHKLEYIGVHVPNVWYFDLETAVEEVA